MWAGAIGTGYAAVEVDVEAQKVDHGVLPVVRDRVRLAVDLHRLSGDQAAVAEFLEQGKQPFFARWPGGRVSGRQFGEGALEPGPDAGEPVP